MKTITSRTQRQARRMSREWRLRLLARIEARVELLRRYHGRWDEILNPVLEGLVALHRGTASRYGGWVLKSWVYQQSPLLRKWHSLREELGRGSDG